LLLLNITLYLIQIMPMCTQSIIINLKNLKYAKKNYNV